jgi:tRNA (cytidine/uridine-2'-O-)-methyltransferase
VRYENPPCHLALFEPEIPPNTGNISRLCAGNGVPLHLTGKLGFSLDDKQLKRAGLDYWPHVDLRLPRDLDDLRASLPGARLWLFSTKATAMYTSVRYQPGDCLVFGPETRGLPESFLSAHPEDCVIIPMRANTIRSLNLSSAAAIGLYEALRQMGG